MTDEERYHAEADRIALYLVGEHAGTREKRIYAEAMEKLEVRLNRKEAVLWKGMLKSRFKMGCIDGGLALRQPASPIRRRIFTMLAVLEASPNYTRYYLSRRFPFPYLIVIALTGLRAIFRAGLGVLMLTGKNRHEPEV